VTIVRGNTPLHDNVRFDGNDYPTLGAGATVAWTKNSDTQYESTMRRDGAVIANTKWIVSEGGTHLRQETTPVRANGDNDVGSSMV